MFTPGQTHRLPIDGQVDIAHCRALFDLAGTATGRARPLQDGLLDHQLDIGTDTPVGKDTDVLEPDKGFDDLTRLTTDEGAFGFDGHASKPEAPSSQRQQGTPTSKQAPDPAGIRRAGNRRVALT